MDTVAYTRTDNHPSKHTHFHAMSENPKLEAQFKRSPPCSFPLNLCI